MADTKSVPFFIVNNFNQDIPTLWVNHKTSDTGIQAWMGHNISRGATVQLGNVQIVSRTSDYFTIFWTDRNNNLYGTEYEYKTELDMGGSNVEAQIQSATPTVDFVQTGEGVLGTADYTKYEVGVV